jgi:hypothetical protein
LDAHGVGVGEVTTERRGPGGAGSWGEWAGEPREGGVTCRGRRPRVF